MSIIHEHDNPKSETDNTPFEIAVSPSVSINQSKASEIDPKTPEDSLDLIRRKIEAEKATQRKIDDQLDRIATRYTTKSAGGDNFTSLCKETERIWIINDLMMEKSCS